jgi:hypothetical protein
MSSREGPHRCVNGASNLHADNADVIREGLALEILPDIAQDRSKNSFGAKAA